MTVATALVYGGWTPAHLLAMLDDEAYLPPTLALKCDRRPDPATGKDVDVPSTQKVEVRRVQQTGQTGAFIEKRYLGRYANRAKYEANMLDLVQNLPRIKGHVVGSVGKFQSTTSELLLVTPWVGLSVEDWNALLGDSSPFKSSCVAVLALARAVLRATQEFHQVGFVHCDLQPQNIVIGHTSTPRKGWYRLNLAETRLIDLEFSLPPLTAVTESGGRQVTIPREWFRDKNNALLWLNPSSHSPQLMPGPIDPGTLKPVDFAGMHPDAPARLQRVDWGADFYTLAWWLEALIQNGNFLDEDTQSATMAYLQALPAKLRAYDRPVDTAKGESVPRKSMPHAPWIAEIEELIGVHDNATSLDFRLPQKTENISRARASPTEQSTLEARQPSSAVPAVAPAKPRLPPPPVNLGATVNPVKPAAVGNTPKTKIIATTLVTAMALAVGGYWYLTPDNATKETIFAEPPVGQSAPAPAAPASDAPTTAPATSAPATDPNKTLEDLRKNLLTLTPGTPEWHAKLTQGLQIFDDTAVTLANKTALRQAINETYLKQTLTATQTNWWKDNPTKKTPPPAEARLWIAATQHLADKNTWLAGLYRLRALVGQVQGFDASPAERATARKNLAALIVQPNEAALTALPPATLLREQENAADLLFAYADFDAATARAAKQPLPAFFETDLLPLLKTMAQGDSPISWLRLGYTAACLLNQPDDALALAQIRKAVSAGDAAQDPIAKTASAYLQLLQAQPKQRICSS